MNRFYSSKTWLGEYKNHPGEAVCFSLLPHPTLTKPRHVPTSVLLKPLQINRQPALKSNYPTGIIITTLLTLLTLYTFPGDSNVTLLYSKRISNKTAVFEIWATKQKNLAEAGFLTSNAHSFAFAILRAFISSLKKSAPGRGRCQGRCLPDAFRLSRKVRGQTWLHPLAAEQASIQWKRRGTGAEPAMWDVSERLQSAKQNQDNEQKTIIT